MSEVINGAMNGWDTLEKLLDLCREAVPGAEFRGAYGTGQAPRVLKQVTAVLGIGAETRQAGKRDIRCEMDIYIPQGGDLRAAEEVFGRVCSAVREEFAQVSEISRERVKKDSVTGALVVPCSVTFTEEDGGGTVVRIGGREQVVSGVAETVTQEERSITAVGESVPFAVRQGARTYQVELRGFDCSGYDRLTDFTAELLGQAPIIYRNCRWKKLDSAQKLAVFTAGGKGETGNG